MKQTITLPVLFTFADNASESSTLNLAESGLKGLRQFAIDFPSGWVAANLGVQVKRFAADATWIPVLLPGSLLHAVILNIPTSAVGRKLFPAEGWMVGNGADLIRFVSISATDVAVTQTGGPLTLYLIPLE